MKVSKTCTGCGSGSMIRRYILLGLLLPFARTQATTAPVATSVQSPTATTHSAFSTYSAPSFTNPSDANSTASSSNPNDDDGGIANYYYVFIAVVLILFGLAFFFWNVRRRNLKMRSRVRSQSALRQDLQNYQEGQRRWLHGMHWRENPALTRYQQGLRRQREEGLNERGEAPPPYIPADSTAVPSNNADQGPTLDGSGNEIAVPLEVLTRDGTALKPPDYSEMYRPAHVAVGSNDRDEANLSTEETTATSSTPQGTVEGDVVDSLQSSTLTRSFPPSNGHSSYTNRAGNDDAEVSDSRP